MPTKTCNTCNLTLDISEFKKTHAKCKKCYKKHTTCKHEISKEINNVEMDKSMRDFLHKFLVD